MNACLSPYLCRTVNESESSRIPSAPEGGGSYDEDDEDSNGYGNADTGETGAGHGPWKKLIPAEEVTQIPVEVEKPSLSKVYVSPALRYSVSTLPRQPIYFSTNKPVLF